MIRPPTGEAFKLMIKKRNVSCKKKKKPARPFQGLLHERVNSMSPDEAPRFFRSYHFNSTLESAIHLKKIIKTHQDIPRGNYAAEN